MGTPLSSIAIDILGMPSTSAATERSFSTFRKKEKRSQFTSEWYDFSETSDNLFESDDGEIIK